jgi:hypothetical protein
MIVQTIFYICGIVAFVLTAVLLLVLILGSLGVFKKTKNILSQIEEGMDGRIARTVIQFIPLAAAVLMELSKHATSKKSKK